jgi:hypothetical protein
MNTSFRSKFSNKIEFLGDSRILRFVFAATEQKLSEGGLKLVSSLCHCNCIDIYRFANEHKNVIKIFRRNRTSQCKMKYNI